MNEPVSIDFTALEGFFRADNNVICASVFGSSQKGWVSPGSDLDIAVLFRDEPFDLKRVKGLRLCSVVSTIEVVDFVNLNVANTILAFESVRGRWICKNDVEKTADFVSLVCREYEDVMGNLEHQRWLRTQAA